MYITAKVTSGLSWLHENIGNSIPYSVCGVSTTAVIKEVKEDGNVTLDVNDIEGIHALRAMMGMF